MHIYIDIWLQGKGNSCARAPKQTKKRQKTTRATRGPKKEMTRAFIVEKESSTFLQEKENIPILRKEKKETC